MDIFLESINLGMNTALLVSNALHVFGSIIRGSSLNANYHKVDELCGIQITSGIHYIIVS